MRRLAVPFLLLFVTFGCATGPETVPLTGAQRYAVASKQLEGLAESMKELVLVGRITDGDRLIQIRSTLTAARIAMDVWGVVPEDLGSETTAILALKAAKSIFRAIAPPEPTEPGGMS